MRKGKLIVIDGADGTGKQTQTAMLEERLKLEGFKTEKFAFPRYDQYFGRMVKRYLEGQFGDPTKINPRLASLLYALDRMDAAPKIKELLEGGAYVLCDRYIESNMGFQAAKIDGESERKTFLLWLEDLEYNQLGVPKSDLVFYLHASADISQRLMKEREESTGTLADGHESNLDFQKRVVETYRWLAGNYSHWRLINCLDSAGSMRTREDIHVEIYTKVKEQEK